MRRLVWTLTLLSAVIGASWTAPSLTTPDATSLLVTGLLPRTNYLFRVKAVDDFGESVWSPQTELLLP